MSILYLVSGLLALGLFRVPALRHVQTGEILMTSASLALIAVYLAVALLCVKPVGLYISHVMEGRPIWPLRIGARAERLIYRLCGVDPAAEMGWKKYAIALLLFNGLGALAVYVLQRLQLWLPLNPQQFANVSRGLRVQHCRELRHQHQLAGLLRRVDDELPHADGGARRAELPLGGDRALSWRLH